MFLLFQEITNVTLSFPFFVNIKIAQEIPGFDDTLNDASTILHKQIYNINERNSSYSKKGNNERDSSLPKRRSLVRKKPPPLTDIDSPKAETGTFTTDGLNFQTNIPLSYALTTENNTVLQQKSMLTLGENIQEMPKLAINQYGPDYWDIIEEDKNLSVRLSERRNGTSFVNESRCQLDASRPSVIGYESQKAPQKEGEEDIEINEESFGNENSWSHFSSPEKKENIQEQQRNTITKPGGNLVVDDNIWTNRLKFSVDKSQERNASEKMKSKSPALYRNTPEQVRQEYLIPEHDVPSFSNKKSASTKQTPERYEMNTLNNHIEQIDLFEGRSRSPTFSAYQDPSPQKLDSFIGNEPNYIALIKNNSNNKYENNMKSSEKKHRNEDLYQINNVTYQRPQEAISIEEVYNIPNKRLYENHNQSYDYEKENTFGMRIANLQESPAKENENNYWENKKDWSRSKNENITGKFHVSDLYDYVKSQKQMESDSLNKASEPMKINDLYDDFKSTDRKGPVIERKEFRSYYSRGKSFDRNYLSQNGRENESFRTDSFNYGSVMTDIQEGDNSRGTARDSKRWESVQRDVQKLIDSTLRSKAGKLDKYLNYEKEKRLSKDILSKGRDDWKEHLGKKTQYSHPFSREGESLENTYQSVNQEQRIYDKERIVTSGWKRDDGRNVQRNWEGKRIF